MKKIDMVRERVLASVYEAGDRSAAMTNPTHDMVEGAKIFIKAAIDFLCSIVNTDALEADADDEAVELVSRILADRVCKMLAVAGGIL